MDFTESLPHDINVINTLRLLSVDMIESAKSGHPGMPLGCAPILYILFKNHLQFNPSEPEWINRDRFILSNGHGCALLYSILHLFKYEIKLDDLKRFRTLASITPGHPEKNLTPGIEVTTGPLGQGIANGVGMALAEKNLSSRFDSSKKVIDHKIYVMCGDGCLMEGVANEAISLAGHLCLNNLIVLYDDNKISIDGSTDLSFTEDTKSKFESLGWEVIIVESADRDLLSINESIMLAKNSEKPVLICMRTKIGFGSDKEGSEKSHGAPLGLESVKNLKKKFNFNEDVTFYISDENKEFIKKVINKKKEAYDIWLKDFESYKIENNDSYENLMKIINRETVDLTKIITPYHPEDKKMATRQTSGAILKELFNNLPQIIGGSADLSPSNNTKVDDAIQKNNYSNRYIHYGVREHAMAAIANGLSTYGFLPFVGTFLIFINYCLAAIRLSALSKHQVFYILTHDSIGLGEDGPTHQPVESLSILRSIPNSLTFRPADGNETIGCYNVALSENDKPSCFCLSRQGLPQLENSNSKLVEKGGYILYENNKKLDLIIVATGSEVSLCLEVVKELSTKMNVRLVSMPCTELFDNQSKEYQEMVLPKNVKKLSVEAGVTLMWYKYADFCYGIDCYGASAKGEEVMNYYGFTKNKIIDYIYKVILVN